MHLALGIFSTAQKSSVSFLRSLLVFIGVASCTQFFHYNSGSCRQVRISSFFCVYLHHGCCSCSVISKDQAALACAQLLAARGFLERTCRVAQQSVVFR